MLYQIPFTILILILVITLTEDNFEIQGLFDSTRPPNEWVQIIVSCLIATLYFPIAAIQINSENKILDNSL